MIAIGTENTSVAVATEERVWALRAESRLPHPIVQIHHEFPYVAAICRPSAKDVDEVVVLYNCLSVRGAFSSRRICGAHTVALSSDGHVVVATSKAILYLKPRGEELTILRKEAVDGLAPCAHASLQPLNAASSPLTRSIVTVCGNAICRVCLKKDAVKLRTLVCGGRGETAVCVFGEEGKQLFIASGRVLCRYSTASSHWTRCWKHRCASSIACLRVQPYMSSVAALCSDGVVLVVNRQGDRIGTWRSSSARYTLGVFSPLQTKPDQLLPSIPLKARRLEQMRWTPRTHRWFLRKTRRRVVLSTLAARASLILDVWMGRTLGFMVQVEKSEGEKGGGGDVYDLACLSGKLGQP